MQGVILRRFTCPFRNISNNNSLFFIEVFGKSARFQKFQCPFSRSSTRQYFLGGGHQWDRRKAFISGIKYDVNGLKSPMHDKFQWTCFYSVLPKHKLSYSNNSDKHDKKDNLDDGTASHSIKKSTTSDSVSNAAEQVNGASKDITDPLVEATATNYATQESSVLEEKKVEAELEGAVLDADRESIFRRFKAAYKEHGKTLLAVHCATSLVWFGSFYYAAHSGLDVHSVLAKIGLPDSLITPLADSDLGNVALAYIMYKIATPARYAVTLGGTRYAIKYLKRIGKIKQVPEGDSLRDLLADSRDRFAQKMEERKEEWSQIMEETKEQLKGQTDSKGSRSKKDEKPTDKK